MTRREQFFNVRGVWDLLTAINFILWGPVELAHVLNVTLSLLIIFPGAISLFVCTSDFVWQGSPKQTAFIGVVDFIWVQAQLFNFFRKPYWKDSAARVSQDIFYLDMVNLQIIYLLFKFNKLTCTSFEVLFVCSLRMKELHLLTHHFSIQWSISEFSKKRSV
jgi:hypothetical protein